MEELISELKDGELTFIIMDMRIAEKRISDLKEEHEQSKAEITRLELVIGDFNKKYKAVESTFAIAAFTSPCLVLSLVQVTTTFFSI
ncbi:unnamed protein product [Microthlaspi erraticum]|uniref:Uncharacterized protein n=1 Tax=Microthlaspi erraticum TaxID=1685480 RepID=A0A6D2HZH3_9BRAS|nr:unnamed protein product [Microthlaspi erraticum]